ncbi:MAG: thioredoxin domain-containing protein [Cyanobacteria bacterium J06635_1]
MSNRLAQSKSLYLRKHAENPIDWWPWGEDAIATARQTDRPIFLSIGYSSCHWCAVMEREAFSSDEIAAYLNAHFLPIKVDREERPDLDSLYMHALQLMVGQRGWPLNIFLSPDDLIPFYGGTYFPIEARYGKPAFLQVLQSLRGLYETDLDKLATIKSQVLAELQPSESLTDTAALNQNMLSQGIMESTQVLIPTDSGASFPMIPYVLTALRGSQLPGNAILDPYQICRQRALDVSLGGIFDHVAGGFHRYTVDPTWTVPHFEKMLYDSGLILEFLAEIWRCGEQAPAIERAIKLTVDWLKREMQAPEGYFYATQDADSLTTPEGDPAEGAFYVWSEAELKALLEPAELAALGKQFMISPGGNFEGATVLQRRRAKALEELVKQGLEKLFQARYGRGPVARFPTAVDAEAAKTQPWPGRIPPVTDTKLIVAWNSLVISGLAKVAVVLDQVDYLTLAMQVAQFILENQWVENRLHRLNYDGQPAILAHSEDYAFLTKALLDIQQTSLVFDAYADRATEWLEQALFVQAEHDTWFWSQTSGGYFNTAKDLRDSLLGQERSYRDTATPTANGVAIANLVRLSLLTENLEPLNQAEYALTAFSAVMAEEPLACPSLFQALDWFQHATLVKTSAEQLPALLKRYLPTVMVAMTGGRSETIAPTLPEGSVGLVCKGVTCLEPAMSLDQLNKQLLSTQSS